ncbi:TonB-dependent receptor [Steroidobacter sp.]|uniref:TonB-dependent receptor n=1 Tax=Steroidobacter sp. TaxID=1978227 RepID=UPI001A4F20CE|nr:TonB-dependent receptor [Steroidobacter sp.]MBL8268735.1 TonB-dependent receptor [Steroidobacter sp.]
MAVIFSRPCITAAVLALCSPAIVAAQTGAAAEVQTESYRLDIPAQPLSDALQMFARLARQQLSFDAARLAGKTSQPLIGEFTAEAALRRLLVGTGIAFRRGSQGVWLVGPAPLSNESARDVEEILVTGSRLSRAGVEGPVPVNIYTRRDIERSGQMTVADFLSTLPEISLASPENSSATYFGESTVRLRGLPVGTTLVLVNGRRVTGGSTTAGFGGYLDLNNIPSGVIERVEVVPEGSSAVYGSDALAGVVNIILKKEIDGVQSNVRYGRASGIDEKSADVAWGASSDRGAISLIGSYYQRSDLVGTERSIVSSNAYGTLIDRCNPGTVYSVDGSNLPGLNSPTAAMTESGDFVAGAVNRCRYTSERALIPIARRASVFGFGSYQLTPQVELFAEFLYTRQNQEFGFTHWTLNRTRVPASNAFNPFGQDVLVSYRFNSAGALAGVETDVDFMRPLIGARGTFGSDWKWEVAAWQAGEKVFGDQRGGALNVANRAAALASSDPATALNLFTTGASASDALLRSIFTEFNLHTSDRSRIVNGFVRGTAFALPAGDVSVVLGAEYVRNDLKWRETASYSTDSAYNFTYDRQVASVFSEIHVPIIAGATAQSGDLLALSGALRYDHYDDFGGHTTPQLALEFRPWQSLLVRAAYAEAFKAPSLISLYYPVYTADNQCCVTDPQRGGESVSYIYSYGGAPGLKPESGESLSAGLVWSPTQIDGLETSLSWWQIKQYDRTTVLDPQTIVDYEALFPGYVTRDPVTRAIQAVSVGFVNFGELQVSGFDFDVSYSLSTAAGTWQPGLRVSQMYQYDAAILPGLPMTDRLSKADDDAWGPRWKGVLSLGWSLGDYSVNVAGRYLGAYADYPLAGVSRRELGDFWLFDLSTKYDLGRAFAANNRYLRDAYLQLSVVNALDSLPRYSDHRSGYIGYDPAQYDIRGRFVTAHFGVQF